MEPNWFLVDWNNSLIFEKSTPQFTLSRVGLKLFCLLKAIKSLTIGPCKPLPKSSLDNAVSVDFNLPLFGPQTCTSFLKAFGIYSACFRGFKTAATLISMMVGGLHSTEVAYSPLTRPSSPGFDSQHFSEEKLSMLLRLNQRCWIEDSGQWLENIDWTHLVLDWANPVPQKSFKHNISPRRRS